MAIIAHQVAIPSNRAVLNVAWPLALKAMMLHGIIVIDAYLVSGLGESALAAMGLASSLGGLLLGFLFAFSNATQIRIAQAFGSRNPVALKTGFYSGLIANLGVAALGLAIVLLFGDQIIAAFAETDWIAEQARRYLGIFMLIVLFEAVGQNIGSHFNGSGLTKIPFVSHLISVPINVVASLILIYGHFGLPAMGVMGAAAGSLVGAAARALYLGVGMYRLNGYFLDVPGWRDGTLSASLRRYMRFALPIAGTFVSMTLSRSVSMLIFAKMSVNQFAAMTLIMPWVQVAGTFGIAWAQATGIVVAQMLGDGRSESDLDAFLSRAWRVAFVAAGLVSATYLVVCLGSGVIYADLQPETKAALLSFLPVLLILPFPKGSNAICGNTLRAGGDTFYVMMIFITGQWLFKVPLTAIFVLYLDLSVTWVFSLLLLEELVKFPMFHLRLFKGAWKRGDVLA